MVVVARQSSKVFRQIICFLWNNRTLSKFKYRILHYLHYLIRIIIFYKRKSVSKNQFCINNVGHLKPWGNLILKKQIFGSKIKFSHGLILVEREPTC